MLEIADESVAGAGDGRISLEDAQKLLDQTLEGSTTDTTDGTTKYGDTTTTETNDIDKAFDELLA